MNQLDPFVENHLNLQVKISYTDHHGFLLRHGLKGCSNVLDVGTGNGTFAARLAQDHPEIQFVGIDKRQPCVESSRSHLSANFDAEHLDMFARKSNFDFGEFDGFLMRYFLLHVDHARKILEILKTKSKRPSRFWVIDLDWSQFRSQPEHKTFDKLTQLVKDFCSQVSPDTLGGQNVVPLLEQMEYQHIVVENLPFTSQNVPLEDFVLYMKQEVLCYSRMLGKSTKDSETAEIINFIESDVKAGKVQVSYGMVLVSAQLD